MEVTFALSTKPKDSHENTTKQHPVHLQAHYLYYFYDNSDAGILWKSTGRSTGK